MEVFVRLVASLKCASALLLLSLTARADMMGTVTVYSAAEEILNVPLPGCSANGSGTSYAAVTFACTQSGNHYSGNATGQLGLGPYGVGGGMHASASGADATFRTTAESRVSLFWTQQFALLGADGSGFVTLHVTDVSVGNVGFGGESLQLSLFGFDGFPGSYSVTLPVTFGLDYVFKLKGKMFCSSFDQIACGDHSLYLSSLDFTDAAGRPLSGVTLVQTPEVSSWMLLAVCAVPVALKRRKLGN